MSDDRAISDLEAQGLRRGEDFVVVRDLLEQGKGGGESPPEDRAAVGLAAHGPFVPARLENYTPPVYLQPGIHFGVSHEDYLAFPALSSHGIKALAASQMIYWQDCRWMNPDYEEEEKKDHFQLGDAYELRIMGGEAAFNARYATALDRRDYLDALVTGDDIKEALAELGLKAKGATKSGWFEQLLEWDPDAQLWERLKDEHAEANAGKVIIPAKAMKKVAITARIVELDEALRAALSGGYPNVVLVWHCAKTGVLMKAETDYIKLRAIVDAKTLVNQRMRSANEAAFREIADRKYTIQPSVYLEGAQMVRQLVREHGEKVVFHHDEPHYSVEGSRGTWALKWADERRPDEWLWLFLQTAYPITRLVRYPRGVNKAVSDEIVSRMKRRFREMTETYHCDPWLDLEGLVEMADEDIHPSALEI